MWTVRKTETKKTKSNWGFFWCSCSSVIFKDFGARLCIAKTCSSVWTNFYFNLFVPTEQTTELLTTLPTTASDQMTSGKLTKTDETRSRHFSTTTSTEKEPETSTLMESTVVQNPTSSFSAFVHSVYSSSSLKSTIHFSNTKMQMETTSKIRFKLNWINFFFLVSSSSSSIIIIVIIVLLFFIVLIGGILLFLWKNRQEQKETKGNGKNTAKFLDIF